MHSRYHLASSTFVELRWHVFLMLNFENLNVMTDIRGVSSARFFIPAPNERSEYDIPKARRQTSAFLHRTRHILTGWFLFNLPKAACFMPQDTLSRPWMAESLNYSFSGFRMGRTTCHKSYFYNKDVQCLNMWYKINLKDSVPKCQKCFASSVSFPQHDANAILCRSKYLVRSSSTGLVGRLTITYHSLSGVGFCHVCWCSRGAAINLAYWLHPSQCRTCGATSSTSFIRYVAALQCLVHTSLTISFQACDILIPPMNAQVPEVSTELPPRVVVASPKQLSAANRRKKKQVSGRFVCNLCPQNFTAKHNLKSQS